MRTALEALHAAHHAQFGQVQGVLLPMDYGDFAAEVQACREGLGVLDLEACGVLLVRGPDAAEFLAGLTTNDVKRLQEGRAQPNLICANKGRILHAVTVVHVKAEQYLVVTEPGELEGVAGRLEAYHIREDAEIGRAPLVRLDLLGPRAAAALQALGTSPEAPLGAFEGAPLLTPPLALGAVPRVMALLPAGHAERFVQALLAAQAGARLVGFAAYDEVRIRAGVPRFGADFDADFLPAEAALYDHLSFNKGCYVGQEVHARLHHRGHVNRKLCGLLLPEAAAARLAPGAELFAGGAAVGRLTSLARLPEGGQRRGIALLRWEPLAAGVPLATAPDGPAELRTVALATDLGAGPA
jgi:folate-binding protein YgfZ